MNCRTLKKKGLVFNLNRKQKVPQLMVVGNIIQEANKGEVHSPENKVAALNLQVTYKTILELEDKFHSKKLMTDEDYKLLNIVQKAKSVLLKLVSRNLTAWDKNRHFNTAIPDFHSNYAINREVYEELSGERYIFCRVLNRLNGVELAEMI